MKNITRCKPARPRRLPIVEWAGTAFFADTQLQEFRTVTSPSFVIHFQSGSGQAMHRAWAIKTCSHCKQAMAIPRTCLHCHREIRQEGGEERQGAWDMAPRRAGKPCGRATPRGRESPIDGYTHKPSPDD